MKEPVNTEDNELTEKRKADVLGVMIDNVTMAEAVDGILGAQAAGSNVSVFTPNSEMVMEALKDPSLMDILNKASFVVPDGAGVVLGARILKENIKEKVAGVDLVGNILASGKSLSVFIFGGKPGVAERAAENIEKRFNGIHVCGTDHGYHKPEETAAVIEGIVKAEPDLLLVGLGVPRQEKWIAENISKFKSSVCIGCGGTIDVFAGEVKRAPSFFIKMNLEWFYRLIKQPARLKRMLRIPVFLLLCLKKRFSR